MSVHREIEKFLRRTDMPASKFGRLAAGDPGLVRDLRNGRELRPKLEARLKAFIAAQQAAERAP
ncbi:hypothetical protein IAG41_10195 [Sphingomonas sp. JC676]|uniref:hypothetical protein n=1 Tax=Sphingomonas sp. JC676 TaxID=2768065 RepID=UPI0016584620|nr:hypothetical protein [Sphingomonas sp. JC676]MBC9032761.1 hypothetical protein [Sphingomonas sp. JC676]